MRDRDRQFLAGPLGSCERHDRHVEAIKPKPHRRSGRHASAGFGAGKRFFKMSPLHNHFELLGWSETQVMQRFVLVGMVAALIGISLALTLRDTQSAQVPPVPQTPTVQSNGQ